MQRIGRDVVGRSEVLRSLTGPIDQRIEFEEIAIPVGSCQGEVTAIRRLVSTKSGYPSFRACKRPLEGLDLSHIATCDARFLCLIKAIDALSRDELLERRMLRIDRANATAIAPFGLLPRRVSFRKQPASVERHDIDVQAGVADVMQDDLIFQPKAGGKNDRSVQRPAYTDKPLG